MLDFLGEVFINQGSRDLIPSTLFPSASGTGYWTANLKPSCQAPRSLEPKLNPLSLQARRCILKHKATPFRPASGSFLKYGSPFVDVKLVGLLLQGRSQKRTRIDRPSQLDGCLQVSVGRSSDRIDNTGLSDPRNRYLGGCNMYFAKNDAEAGPVQIPLQSDQETQVPGVESWPNSHKQRALKQLFHLGVGFLNYRSQNGGNYAGTRVPTGTPI